MPLDDRYQRLPFEAAIEFMAEKITLPSDSWRDFSNDEHDAVFMVAGAKGAVLSDLRTAVDSAIADGQRPEEFRDRFEAITADWDDMRGDAAWRSDTIYFTNLRAAYGRGRDQLQFAPEVVAAQPYVKYEHSDSRHPRPLHLALDGKIFRKDNVPFALPSGFGCSCRYTSLSDRDLERLGLEVSELQRGDTLPPVEVDGNIYRPVLEPAEGWDRMPNPNPQQRREEILRRIADRAVPEIGEQIINWLAQWLAAQTEA